MQADSRVKACIDATPLAPGRPRTCRRFRIGPLGLLDGAKIAVMDQTLSPPATSTAYIDTLAIENIDTTDPAARSDVRMRARLDQAEVTVDGWALPFQPKPDFELRAKVSELVLPSVNPYVGPRSRARYCRRQTDRQCPSAGGYRSAQG